MNYNMLDLSLCMQTQQDMVKLTGLQQSDNSN